MFLRSFCEYNPLKLFETMESEKKDNLIKFIWDKVCEQFDQEQKTELTPEDIKVSTLRLGRHQVILVQMPEAMVVAEAVMAAIVLFQM
jgi:hypothetical protein